jgi:hypothetical protein
LRWRRLSVGQHARIEGVVEVTHQLRDQPAFIVVTKDFCERPRLQSRPYGRVGTLFQFFHFPFVRLLVEPLRFAVSTDGAPGEPELQGLLDFGQAIEPFDELLAWLAVFEAAVQVLADVLGEPSDFAIASDHRNLLRIEAAEGSIFDFRFAICD